MIETAERLLDRFAAGRISRRQAAQALVGLAAATVGAPVRGAAASAGDPTFRATGLNHLGARVSDVERSRDFYQRLLGMTVIQDNTPGNCFLAAGENYFGLFRSDRPAVDHFCFTVEGYSAGDAMSKLSALGLSPHRVEDRVYFDDPDGLQVQLDSRFGSWPGANPPG